MSRDRCPSLDRAKWQQKNVLQCAGYVPERSPHRSPPKPVSPQYSPSTPDILRDSFPGGSSSYSLEDFDLCPTPKRLTRPLELQQEHALEHQRLYSPPKVPQPQDLPVEYLEDLDQPSFSELPANSSFDELMCILATPPSRRQASAAHHLSAKALGSEVESPQKTSHKVNTDVASSPALCPYKIPPLPDDPYDIPPHPKDPKDVVGFIRRSRAIHRLNALQEAEAANKLPKGGARKGVSGAIPRTKPPLVVPKRPSDVRKFQVRKNVPQPQKPKAVVRKKNYEPEHPPGYVAPEYVAEILRARQLAGLKTRNPKLLPKSNIAPPPQPKAAASPAPPRRISPPRTYASIVERAAALRAKTKAVRAESLRQQEPDVCPIMTTEYVDNTDLQPQLVKPAHYREATAEEIAAELNRKAEEEHNAFLANERKAEEEEIAAAKKKLKKKRDAELHRKIKEENCEFLALEKQAEEEEIAAAKKKRADELKKKLAKKKRDRKIDRKIEEENYEFLALEKQAEKEEIAAAKKKLADELKKKLAKKKRDRKIDRKIEEENYEFLDLEKQAEEEEIAAAKKKLAKKERDAELDRKIEEENNEFLALEEQAHKLEKIYQREKAIREAQEEHDEYLANELHTESRSTHCPSNFSPNKFEAQQERIRAIYSQAKLLDPGRPQSAAEQNYIADQIRLMGSAKRQSAAAESSKRIKELETMLLGETLNAESKSKYCPSNISQHKSESVQELHSAAEQNYIADQIGLMGSAKRQLAVEATAEALYKRAKELETMLLRETLNEESKSKDCPSNISQHKSESVQELHSAAEQNYTADQIRLMGSAKRQLAVEATAEAMYKRAKELETMLLRETLNEESKSKDCPSNISQHKSESVQELHSAAEQNYTADQIRLRGSAKRQLPVEAQAEAMYKRAKELEAILETSVTTETAQSSPTFEMPPVIRYFELLRRRRETTTAESCTELDIEECIMPEYASEPKQFQDLADWNLANISGTSDVCPSPSAKSPRLPAKVVAPHTSGRICLSSIDENLFEAVDVGIEYAPIPSYLTKADLDYGEDINLGDITMPEDGFDKDMTPTELDLEDVSSPELDDVSISMLEGYDPDYPSEYTDKSHDKDLEIIQEQQTSPGFLTTVVSAVVDKFRNIFGGTPRDVGEDEDEPSHCINLDSTLPNMFATTPPPRSTPTDQDPTVIEEPFTIPKYPKEYIAMVKKSQQIYKQKAMEAAEAAKASKGRKKPVLGSTISKRVQPPGGRGKPGYQKKQAIPPKVYPPGEYSPSYAAEVARARTLAGYKNRSAILNPERAAKIAAIKAAKEAELAAEEALPPVERMRKRISRLKQKGSRLCPRPSIETLGTLEAIRANLPRPRITSLPKPKWEPATRRRADKGVEEMERVFTKSPIRVFEQFKPMSPLTEESYNEEDLIRFTPLRAREAKLRLQHLKEQAEKRDRDMFNRLHQTDNSRVEHLCTPEPPIKYTPIRLQSPSRPRSKELEKHTKTTAQVVNRGEESIREEVTKTSTIENGDVHTTTRKVTTTTDKFGNVTCRIDEDTGLMDDEDDDIDAIDAPEFLHISDIESPRDPSIPTPSQIIDRMRMQVQQKLNLVLPQISPDIESSADQSLALIEFPEDLPDEQLYDIDMPELETTPQQMFSQPKEQSPDTSLPHFWNEEQQPRTSQSPSSCPPTTSAVQRTEHASPLPKQEAPEGPVIVPPCPKDPKDYIGMVKYARAIHKRKQQQEAEAAARRPPPVAVKKKPVRVPISRRIGKNAGKQLLLKSKPKKVDTPKLEDDNVEPPTEPPPLPSGYAEEVARARKQAGYKNKTAALNPKVAAKKAAEEAALAEFEALSEYQKIMRRMEKVRRIQPQKRIIQPSADILGTLEGIRANMPPIGEVLQPNASPIHQTPISKTVLPLPCTPKQLQEMKLMEVKELETQSPNLSLDEFLANEEECLVEVPGNRTEEHSRNLPREEFEKQSPNLSLDEFLANEEECLVEVPGIRTEEHSRNLPREEFEKQSPNLSLDEFLANEEECLVEVPGNRTEEHSRNLPREEFEKQSPNLSLDEFLANEEECLVEVPGNRTEEYSRNLPREEFEKQVTNVCRNANFGEFKDSAETPKNLRKAQPRNIMEKYIAQHDERLARPGSPQTNPLSYNEAYYQQLIEDFCPASKHFGIEGEVAFGELASPTPVDPKERLRRIKAYQELACPMRELDAREDTFVSPSVEYSPIRLFTPTGEPRPVTPREISPVHASKNKLLVDLETPKIEYRVKQFKDLEDMPFDVLECEDEPSFATASFEKPPTPPPQPSELISRIRKQVKERLRNDKALQDQIASVSNFQFPELPEEDLFEISDPSFGHTPTIQRSAQSPKISHARVPSPVRTPTATPTIQQAPQVDECPVNPTEEMYKPKYPKGYVEMVMKARAIHKLKQQQQAEMAAAPPPSEPTKKKGRIPTTKPGGKVVMKKGLVRPPKIIKKKQKEPVIEMDDEIECPAEAPPLPPEYLAEVARARQLAGYKNRTAALNPEVAAEEAAFAALSEHEKIKVRMERLRKKSGHRQRLQPSMEQLAFIQAMKETCTYETPTRDPSPSTVKSYIPQHRVSITPRCNRSGDTESSGLAEFLAIEQEEQAFIENPPELADVAFGQVEMTTQLQMKADAQKQQLATPRERYKRFLTQVQPIHKTPVPLTPVQTPDIHFSPIRLASSPTMNAKDTSEIEDELAGIEQPSFLDITSMSPIDVPRPRDIIERIRREVKAKPRPDVPTGQLIDLRTPPRELALPQNVTEEELFEMSCPGLPKTPTKSPIQSPRRSPVRPQDLSIPELFVATPEPPTPPLPPVSPLRYRVHSPEGPIVIPPCPKDPRDYKGMVRMSRKIYELKLQKEAEAKAAADAAAIEASKPKKKERVPISRWTAPPPRKPTKRKKLVMRKRVPVEKKFSPDRPEPECPSEPPPLPEGYAEEVARARYLAGLKNRTAALNPKVATREAAAKTALNTQPRPPADYKTLISRMESMRKFGHVPKAQPSLQAAAYLNAVKGAMATAQSTGQVESAETRYKKILAARAHSALPAPEDRMEITALPEDVRYTPVVLGSPTTEYVEGINFNILGLQDIGDLEEIQEPSFLDETGGYRSPSPKTPPPTPSAIIRRIRKQVQEKLAADKLAYSISSETPTHLAFPEDLPDEELFELSAPSFARTPQSQSPTQVFTPNVSIPQYFEATPQSKLPTPMSLSTKRPETDTCDMVKETHASASPPLMGVHRGLRVVTPEGPLVLPPHPKGRESVVDMIRRAQLIHKIKQKEEAVKADAKVVQRRGIRVPISRRPGGPITRAPKSLKPVRPKEKTRKKDNPQVPVECPAEPPELPPEYIAEVARARRLAGLKNTTALLNPPQDYGTIMARVAALKMARGEIEPTAQELAEAQNVIRRPERKEAKEQQQTPRPAIERYRAYRSQVPSQTPTTSQIPYSPVKTPVLDQMPSYKPICLAPTPPFLQNINMSDIGDISMPYDMDEI